MRNKQFEEQLEPTVPSMGWLLVQCDDFLRPSENSSRCLEGSQTLPAALVGLIVNSLTSSSCCTMSFSMESLCRPHHIAAKEPGSLKCIFSIANYSALTASVPIKNRNFVGNKRPIFQTKHSCTLSSWFL